MRDRAGALCLERIRISDKGLDLSLIVRIEGLFEERGRDSNH